MREISFYIHYNTPYPHLPLVQRTPDTWERFSRVFRDATWGGKESPLILNIISRNQRLEIRICILDARSRIILQNRMRCNCCSYSRVLDGSENCTSEIFFFWGGGNSSALSILKTDAIPLQSELDVSCTGHFANNTDLTLTCNGTCCSTWKYFIFSCSLVLILYYKRVTY